QRGAAARWASPDLQRSRGNARAVRGVHCDPFAELVRASVLITQEHGRWGRAVAPRRQRFIALAALEGPRSAPTPIAPAPADRPRGARATRRPAAPPETSPTPHRPPWPAPGSSGPAAQRRPPPPPWPPPSPAAPPPARCLGAHRRAPARTPRRTP